MTYSDVNDILAGDEEKRKEYHKIVSSIELMAKLHETLENMRVKRGALNFDTNEAKILVDKQGVTGKKTSYKSLPYRSISRFSVETSGHFDLDAELKIWVSSAVEPSEILQFKSDNSVIEIQQALASAVFK